MFSARKDLKPLSELEHLVMRVLWKERCLNAEQVRDTLATRHPMKESTVRTVLKRLEIKGYVTHRVQGRTNVYSVVHSPHVLAAKAVRQILARFCGGSVEQLLIGMVNSRIVDEHDLKRMADRILASGGTVEEE